MSLSARSTVRLVHALALALGVAFIAIAPVAPVLANGPHVGTQEVYSGTSGPYTIRVLTAPVVGTMHVTIYVARSDVGIPVKEADIGVSSRGPRDASGAVGLPPATAAFGNPGWYAVNLPIKEAGEWTFTVTVTSALGTATVDFPVKVQSSGGINWGLILVLMGVLGLAVWTALSWRKGKKRPPQALRRG